MTKTYDLYSNAQSKFQSLTRSLSGTRTEHEERRS